MALSFRRPPGRHRRRLMAVAGLLSLVLPLVVAASGGASTRGGASGARVAALRIFAPSPVLVRAGERVRIPVDAACSTARGSSCRPVVTLRVRRPGGDWSAVTAAGRPDLVFDLSTFSRRGPSSLLSGGSERVSFRVTAVGPGAARALLPARREGGSSGYFVAEDIPSLPVPVVDFGDVRDGEVALYLPWGTGPDQAGLAPGVEASTIGPSAFDVDAQGHIVLVDQLQNRVARFDGAGLLGAWNDLHLGVRSDVALASDGSAFVASSPLDDQPLATVMRLDSNGASPPSPIGALGDIPTEIRSAGDQAYLRVLPLDAWLPVAEPGTTGSSTGRPLDDGSQLLKVVGEHSVRLARLVEGEVTDPVELLFGQNVGEIALAEPDGAGGYLAVVHVWREIPTAADQYDVIHVDAGHDVKVFAVAAEAFAETSPLSTFRLGGDGFLYQLTSAPDGLRIVRYDLGGIR
ncbi:MAG: hypothetical protein ABR600_00755 [Actinomycetota bacterium]